MTESTHNMKSIWFFVGLVLMTMGGLVFLAGLIDYFSSVKPNTVLSHTYPGIWWGGLMIAAGFAYYWKNRKS